MTSKLNISTHYHTLLCLLSLLPKGYSKVKEDTHTEHIDTFISVAKCRCQPSKVSPLNIRRNWPANPINRRTALMSTMWNLPILKPFATLWRGRCRCQLLCDQKHSIMNHMPHLKSDVCQQYKHTYIHTYIQCISHWPNWRQYTHWVGHAQIRPMSVVSWEGS